MERATLGSCEGRGIPDVDDPRIASIPSRYDFARRRRRANPTSPTAPRAPIAIVLGSGTHIDTVSQTNGTWVETSTARTIRDSLFDEHGAPKLTAYLAYFGLLFPVLRWWELADPLRRSRVKLWSAFGCGLWAFVLSLFWQFPSGAGMAVAFTIACSVQLASPWVNRRLRRAQRSA